MTWFYVDDHMAFNAKVVAAGNGAMGLWVRAGSLGAQQNSDGVVLKAVAAAVGTRAEVSALLRVGLWHAAGHSCDRCPDPGPDAYVYHDWLDVQPSKAEVEDKRAKRAAAGAKGGRRSGATRRARSSGEAPPPATGEADAKQMLPGGEAKTNPVPSRPVPTNPSLVTLVCRRLSGDARAATTTDQDRAELYAMWGDVAGPGVDLDAELRLWFLRNAETDLRDPAGALLGWLRKARERNADAAPLGCGSCTGGWLPEDPETGRPRPCMTCRPHIRAAS